MASLRKECVVCERQFKPLRPTHLTCDGHCAVILDRKRAKARQRQKGEARVAYEQHMYGAMARGIPFIFEFDEWREMWEPYWDQRGPSNDEFCMARLCDMGPYARCNVRIVKGSDNRARLI